MKLLFDIGNSRVKWAWCSGSVLERAGDIVHLDQDLDEVIEALPLRGPAPDAVLAASVAARHVTGAVADAVQHSWGLTMRMAESELAACGVRSGYSEPRQLGVDRWLAMLGARHRHRSPLCVVDAGTAVTIDLVTADGEHRGGVIVPGLTLMQATLHRDTGQIEEVRRLVACSASPTTAMGRDTAACVGNGALLAIAGLVRHCAREASTPTRPAMIVITGGDAPVVTAALQGLPLDHRPLLVLEGLALRHGGG